MEQKGPVPEDARGPDSEMCPHHSQGRGSSGLRGPGLPHGRWFCPSHFTGTSVLPCGALPPPRRGLPLWPHRCSPAALRAPACGSCHWADQPAPSWFPQDPSSTRDAELCV